MQGHARQMGHVLNGTTDWFKFGKRVRQAVYCHPAYLTYMQSISWGFPGSAVVKTPPANAGKTRDMGLIPRLGRSPGEGNGYLANGILPERVHGQRSLADYSPWGHEESDTTEQLKL